MRRLAMFFLPLLLAALVFAPPTLATKKEMTVKEASQAAQKLFKDFPFKMLEVKKSPVEGLWEARLILEGRFRVLYIDSTGNLAFFPGKETQGHLIDLNGTKSLTAQSMQEMGHIDFKTIPLDDAIILGNKDAAHKVAVFDDPL